MYSDEVSDLLLSTVPLFSDVFVMTNIKPRNRQTLWAERKSSVIY